MTTNVHVCLLRVSFLLIGLILALLPLFAGAQTEVAPSPFTSVVPEIDSEELIAPSLNGTSTAPQIAVPAEPWFRVEKLTGDALAQGDFVVGPGRAEIEVQPGQTVVYEISIANRISDNRTFELTVEDIAGSPDASRAVLLLGEERGPYTVKDYISFPENTFTLDLGERARIPVTITIPPDAEPAELKRLVLQSSLE
jgi:hypothetical protein